MTTQQVRRWSVSSALKGIGFSFHSPPDTYRGKVRCGHLNVGVELRITDLEFSEKPTVHLLDRDQIPSDVLAHLEVETGICYSDGQNLRLDPYDPAGSILRVLQEVESTLNTSMNANGLREISREYSSYWKGVTVLFPVALEANVTEGVIIFSALGQPMFVPAGYTGPLLDGVNRRALRASVLRTAREVRPINGKTIAPSDFGSFREWWIGNGLEDDLALSAVDDVLHAGGYVIAAAPNAILGARLSQVRRLPKHQKKERDASISETVAIDRLRGERADLEYVTSRCLGSASAPLEGLNVVLVGCGTIGSYLARMLCQVGAGLNGQLTLVDDDLVKAENLGRHACDFAAVGEGKVQALSGMLGRLHPEIQVVAVAEKIQSAWGRAARADVIIDATGTENVSEWLNSRALEEAREGVDRLIVHGWVFGNGAAAQAFIHRPSNGGACLRCLRPRLDQPWLSSPLKRPHEDTKVVEADCGGGAYVPFSVGSSSIAASLLLDAVLDATRGKVTRALRTRIIDFETCKSTANGDFDFARSPDCPACGHKHDSD
jgi:molybdopterin/thiamine biosynthesis adenylyltransferase